MPNWCDNTLSITGNAERLKEFVNTNCDVDLLNLDALVTCPEELKNPPDDCSQEYLDKMIKKYKFSSAYDWRVHHWGTKWTCELYTLDFYDNEVILGFSSAWCPPIEWLQKVALIYPDLQFEMSFMETGCDIAGKCIIEGDCFEYIEGEIVQQDEEGREVKYDSEKDTYVYVDNGNPVEEEYFTPICVNSAEI